MHREERCGLCGRRFNSNDGRYPVGEPEGHHQPPRKFRRRKWYKPRKYVVCSRCHKYIHNVFTHRELADMDFDEVKVHPRVQNYIKWITKFDISHFLKTHKLDKTTITYKKRKKKIISGDQIYDIGYFYFQTAEDFVYTVQVEEVSYDGEVMWQK